MDFAVLELRKSMAHSWAVPLAPPSHIRVHGTAATRAGGASTLHTHACIRIRRTAATRAGGVSTLSHVGRGKTKRKAITAVPGMFRTTYSYPPRSCQLSGGGRVGYMYAEY